MSDIRSTGKNAHPTPMLGPDVPLQRDSSLSNLIHISLSQASVAVDVEAWLISSVLNFSGDCKGIQNVDSSIPIEIS